MKKSIKQDTKAKKSKKQYRISNWHDYNVALVQRGSLEVWLPDDLASGWYAEPAHTQGAQQVYTDGAIETVLTIREVFHLPLRATEGFTQSIFKQSEVTLDVPDYTTLCRRMQTLEVRLPKQKKEKLTMVLDSSGLKVFGEGEWKVRQHGYSKRRTWKKIHIGIDKDGEVRAVATTDKDTHDSTVASQLIAQESASIETLAADGAYDKRSVYALCEERGIPHILIPPQHNAKIFQHGNAKGLPHPRDENLRMIRQLGRAGWKEKVGYHVRSLVENGMFRIKTIFGEGLRSRTDIRQANEIKLICSALNRMTYLGMPNSYPLRRIEASAVSA